MESPPQTTGPGLRTHLSSAGASGGDAVPLKAGFQTASVLSRGSLRPGRTDAALRARGRADAELRGPAVAQVIPGAPLLAPPSRGRGQAGWPDGRPRQVHGQLPASLETAPQTLAGHEAARLDNAAALRSGRFHCAQTFQKLEEMGACTPVPWGCPRPPLRPARGSGPAGVREGSGKQHSASGHPTICFQSKVGDQQPSSAEPCRLP